MRREVGGARLVLVGIGAGLLAAWVMEQTQTALASLQSSQGGGGESSTVKAADRVALAATGEPVPEPKREDAGRIVHYTVGAGLGVFYVAAAARWRGATAGFGVAFGLMVSVVLDEIGVPALRLSPPPDKTPAPDHVVGAVAHAVFGMALEGARRALLRGG